jgi:predicted Zn-ribbon and HTH transcriptional regulator
MFGEREVMNSASDRRRTSRERRQLLWLRVTLAAPRHCQSCGYDRAPDQRGKCPDCGVPI